MGEGCRRLPDRVVIDNKRPIVDDVPGRARHPKKQIEGVLQDAEAAGFTIRQPWGHWGGLVCPGDRPITPIWSTPKNADNHAKHLRRVIDRCPHTQ